jgi:large subunit ribosomal protein L13
MALLPFCRNSLLDTHPTKSESPMDVNSFKTMSAKPAEVERAWHIVDAENQIVGRLSSQIAAILRGKHKPSFTPHVDCGDFVIVINADKVRFTGDKENDKEYFRHTGYPGGGRVRTPAEVRVKKPTFMVQNAVKGMLPKGVLGRQMLTKLKVYAGSEHPHGAQQPTPLEF